MPWGRNVGSPKPQATRSISPPSALLTRETEKCSVGSPQARGGRSGQPKLCFFFPSLATWVVPRTLAWMVASCLALSPNKQERHGLRQGRVRASLFSGPGTDVRKGGEGDNFRGLVGPYHGGNGLAPGEMCVGQINPNTCASDEQSV